MPKVLGAEHRVVRPGRPARVNITEFKKVVDAHPGEWVEEVYNENDAQSAKRQFQKLRGYEVMTSKHSEDGMRAVTVRRGR